MPSAFWITNSESVAYIGVAMAKKYHPAISVGSSTNSASRAPRSAILRRRRRAMSRWMRMISAARPAPVRGAAGGGTIGGDCGSCARILAPIRASGPPGAGTGSSAGVISNDSSAERSNGSMPRARSSVTASWSLSTSIPCLRAIRRARRSCQPVGASAASGAARPSGAGGLSGAGGASGGTGANSSGSKPSSAGGASAPVSLRMR